jgi:hypothetical protein
MVSTRSYQAWHVDKLSNVEVVLKSGPASLDGSGAMMLLKRTSSAPPPKL